MSPAGATAPGDPPTSDATPRRAGPTGLVRFVPISRWACHYPRPLLRGDLVAGLTVAVMLIPQGMAYANLAGMPPVTGLTQPGADSR